MVKATEAWDQEVIAFLTCDRMNYDRYEELKEKEKEVPLIPNESLPVIQLRSQQNWKTQVLELAERFLVLYNNGSSNEKRKKYDDVIKCIEEEKSLEYFFETEYNLLVDMRVFHSFIHSSSLHLFISSSLHLFISSSLHLFISSSLHLFIFWKPTHIQDNHESFLREYRYFLYKVKNSLNNAIQTEYARNPNLFGIHSSESLAQFWGKSEEEDVYKINDLLEISIDTKRDFGSERVYIKKKKQPKGTTLVSSLFSALSSEEVANNHLKQLEASINLAMRKTSLFPLTHSFTHSFTHSLFHSFTLSLFHSFTYSLIHRFQRGSPSDSTSI